QTTQPIRLPWLFRHVGPVTMHTFVSGLDDPGRHPDEAWLWGARVAFQPHGRLTFAANRASIFGTKAEPVTAVRVLRMAAGVIRNSAFENQIVSLEGRYRLPTDRVLPATIYMELGADDGAGALDEVPGIVAGVFLPALPGVPEVAAGAEYTRFAVVCCGHGPWYFNATQRGGWAHGTHPLAHPLGGEGWEALGYAGADLLRSRLRLDARGFVRHRSDASFVQWGGANLYAPVRVGRSRGVALDAAFRHGRVDMRATYFRDAGDGWREERLTAGAALFF
ncbi:MAG: capsule assembly Wzi family protein, partial [Gemmatimonadetes bacterium]|nr:capsule assembly Wzi family protein [Gemmatimonadota bacterium]